MSDGWTGADFKGIAFLGLWQEFSFLQKVFDEGGALVLDVTNVPRVGFLENFAAMEEWLSECWEERNILSMLNGAPWCCSIPLILVRQFYGDLRHFRIRYFFPAGGRSFEDAMKGILRFAKAGLPV